MFPEHTLASYSSAYFNGADWVEIDLQLTNDSHLINSHDPCLRETTNIDTFEWLWGHRRADYLFTPYMARFTQDYLIKWMTLSELKMLTRRFRYNTRNVFMNEQGFQMVTLEETIEMLLNLNANYPKEKKVGLYLETKMYGYYKEQYNEDIVERVFEVLQKYGIETLDKASEKLPVIVESFEREALLRMRELTDLPLVYLMFYMNPMVSYNLTEIGEWAHGVGPNQNWLMNDGRLPNETSKFVDDAHAAELAVHPYSLQDDMLKWTPLPIDEHELFLSKGVDGIFTEFPHTTKASFSYFKSNTNFPASTQPKR